MNFLPTELLTRIHGRADAVDAQNAFPTEDFQDLKAAGYYGAFVPKEFGGAGLNLQEISREQTRLAQAAPATALAINMHQIIVGLGRHLVANGVETGEQILREAVAGELFAFGISEPGNDLVLFGSQSEARPDTQGGFTFHGAKIFTSMAPAWSRLLTFGRDTSSPDDAPRSVFAILHRDRGGFEIKDDWDVLGMRGTQSNTHILDGAPAPAEQVLQRVAAGFSFEPVVFGIFAYFEVLLGATYLGIGDRAIEVAAEKVHTRKSVLHQDVYANDPDIRWRLADAAIEMHNASAVVHNLARALDENEDRGPMYYPQLSAAKNAAAEASRHAVEQGVRAMGGSSYYNSQEMSRLYRDVLAGLFQPSDQESLHSAWASVVLGS